MNQMTNYFVALAWDLSWIWEVLLGYCYSWAVNKAPLRWNWSPYVCYKVLSPRLEGEIPSQRVLPCGNVVEGLELPLEKPCWHNLQCSRLPLHGSGPCCSVWGTGLLKRLEEINSVKWPFEIRTLFSRFMLHSCNDAFVQSLNFCGDFLIIWGNSMS